MQEIYVAILDPIMESENERLTLTYDIKEVHIRPLDFQITKLGTSLTKDDEEELATLFRRNVNLFTSASVDMPRIDAMVGLICVTIDSIVKP